MKLTGPPRMATWILKQFGVNAALVGDLAEEFRGQRSATWYWRQVVVAVLVATANDVTAHKVAALRDIAIGWTVLLLIFAFFGDRVANGLAYQIWGWARAIGYGPTFIWSP